VTKRLFSIAAVAAIVAALAGAPVRAERADRDRPVNIESDRMSADDGSKTAVFEGRVVLTQGTLTIRAERLSLRQDKEGFQYGVAAGNLATFRQKRDGCEDYIEGEAERIEYDGRSERIQFFERARLRREAGDDVRGSYISYDSRTSHFTVHSAKDAAPGSADSRVRVVIMPKNKESDSKDCPPPRATTPAGEPRAR
jgi:lipopolysaccharide export system protein LptA